MNKRTTEKLKELKRSRRILDGATVTMLFDLLVLWFEEQQTYAAAIRAMKVREK